MPKTLVTFDGNVPNSARLRVSPAGGADRVCLQEDCHFPTWRLWVSAAQLQAALDEYTAFRESGRAALAAKRATATATTEGETMQPK